MNVGGPRGGCARMPGGRWAGRIGGLLALAIVLVPLLARPASMAAATPVGGSAAIRVDAGRVVNRITDWMYGACIEDVNHEIYGGLYAQRIFGESFEEPPPVPPPLAGWRAYGGQWRVRGGALVVAAEAGAKVVRDAPELGDGTVECEVRFADDRGENAGLILRVRDPRVGADTWTGYEISLSPRDKTLLLGRHRNDWQPLRTVSAPVVPGRWHRLRVALDGPTVRVFLDAAVAPALEYTDRAEVAILSGRVGLRTWNSNAAFRRLRISAKDRATVSDDLGKPAPAAAAPATVSGMWDGFCTGTAPARYAWDAVRPFNTAHSQRIERGAGSGIAGVANRGLNRWGIAVRTGQELAGRLYLRQVARPPVGVTVALQSADGTKTYARQRLAPSGTSWLRRDFSLRPAATDPRARFAVYLDRPGSVWVDQVYLGPTTSGRFRGEPVRADIADKMVDQGLRFLRYGGTMVNAPAYRWKQMIGPPDRRPQYRGHWYPHSTNGFGIEEFLRFCEAAGFEPSFAINIDETPQDAADLVEYLNGPATSPWGRRRAANGHPKPYNVRYIQIGNEEGLDGNRDWYRRYLERFKLLYAAMRPKDPDLQFVVAAWWRPEEPLVKQTVQELNGKAALWDLHPWADGLRDADAFDRQVSEMRRLFQEWAPGTTMKACVFEENGNTHSLRRALSHAHFLNTAQRHGDFVLMDCPANALQPWKQNDNGWDQGQIFFAPDTVWGMPPFWAQRMAAQNHLPLRVASETRSPDDELDVTATRSEDGRTLVVKVVNLGSRPHATDLRFDGFGGMRREADVWTLTGPSLDAINPPEEPDRIRARRSVFRGAAARFSYAFPAYSYTVLRLRR